MLGQGQGKGRQYDARGYVNDSGYGNSGNDGAGQSRQQDNQLPKQQQQQRAYEAGYYQANSSNDQVYNNSK